MLLAHPGGPFWAKRDAGGKILAPFVTGGISIGRTVTDSCDVIAKLPEAGADVMVTPCPLCHLSLDAWQSKLEAATDALVEELRAFSPLAQRTAKALLNQTEDTNLAGASNEYYCGTPCSRGASSCAGEKSGICGRVSGEIMRAEQRPRSSGAPQWAKIRR